VVHDVIADQLNPQIEALAQANNLPFVDMVASSEAIFGEPTSYYTNLFIGNVEIDLLGSDTNLNTIPTAAFVHDGRHPHTTVQGMIANMIMESFNIGYGANFALFSEEEILAHAGIAYGGLDTLPYQIPAYSEFIVNYVPEPSNWLLAACGGVGLLATARRRQRRGAAQLREVR
jgi:hypothetical protein